MQLVAEYAEDDDGRVGVDHAVPVVLADEPEVTRRNEDI